MINYFCSKCNDGGQVVTASLSGYKYVDYCGCKIGRVMQSDPDRKASNYVLYNSVIGEFKEFLEVDSDSATILNCG
jgi:hypothetical protein